MAGWLLTRRPEWLVLIVNLCVLASYVWKWTEPGRITYWAGVCLLTVGLLLMKG